MLNPGKTRPEMALNLTERRVQRSCRVQRDPVITTPVAVVVVSRPSKAAAAAMEKKQVSWAARHFGGAPFLLGGSLK